jgi:hypothetical protein
VGVGVRVVCGGISDFRCVEVSLFASELDKM